jgi:hypothetical protein
MSLHFHEKAGESRENLTKITGLLVEIRTQDNTCINMNAN